MSSIAQWLADPAVRSWYLFFCFAVMILPMIVMAVWYHTNIGKTAGGRALMERQNRSRFRSRGSLFSAFKSMWEGVGMMQNIDQGHYGTDAKRMQVIVYWFTALWFAANCICFGILLWADELNK